MFSLGSDNQLIEYDIENCQVENGVQVLSAMHVCPGVEPTALAFGPPLAYYAKGSADTELILAGEIQ